MKLTSFNSDIAIQKAVVNKANGTAKIWHG